MELCLSSSGTTYSTRITSSPMLQVSLAPLSTRINLDLPWVDPSGFRRFTTDTIERSSSPTIKVPVRAHRLATPSDSCPPVYARSSAIGPSHLPELVGP